MLKLYFSQVVLSILPENSGEEQAELSTSICVPIFIAYYSNVGGEVYGKFWNKQHTACSMQVILHTYICLFE